MDQNLVPILGDPNKMVFTPISCMSRFPVLFHTATPLLQRSGYCNIPLTHQQCWLAKGVGPLPPHPTTDIVSGLANHLKSILRIPKKGIHSGQRQYPRGSCESSGEAEAGLTVL